MTNLLELSEPTVRGVRRLILKRGDKANALSREMVEKFHSSLDEIGEETRLLVIQSDSKNFCAGFDMSDVEASSESDLVLRFIRINELLARLRHSPFITVAWISGAAYGAGADIACSCAFRVAVGSVKFRFPGFQFGVALGTRRLMQIVGPDRARKILLTNDVIATESALATGLITDAVDDGEMHGFVDNLMNSTARLDREAIGTLLGVTDPQAADEDLAALVRSVSRPGLLSRIAAYRAA